MKEGERQQNPKEVLFTRFVQHDSCSSDSPHPTQPPCDIPMYHLSNPPNHSTYLPSHLVLIFIKPLPCKGHHPNYTQTMYCYFRLLPTVFKHLDHFRPFVIFVTWSQHWENQGYGLQYLVICYASGALYFWWCLSGDSWILHLIGSSLFRPDLHCASNHVAPYRHKICCTCLIGESVLSFSFPRSTDQVSTFWLSGPPSRYVW